MNVLKGVYHDGVIDLIETPKFKDMSEVYVIFPEKRKRIKKLFGLCKDDNIDYDQIEKDLKELSRNSEKHLLEEFNDYE